MRCLLEDGDSYVSSITDNYCEFAGRIGWTAL
jgi:hypothetical protein